MVQQMLKFWNVIEEQVNQDGSKGMLTTAYDDKNQAYSKFYAILSTAAVSTIPYHAAYILESNRGVIESKYYDRSEASADG